MLLGSLGRKDNQLDNNNLYNFKIAFRLMGWKTVDRPGYFGEKRDELWAGLDMKYGGPRGWRIAWEWGGLILERPEALQLYEDGYYEHFKTKPELLEWLVKGFSNVFDTAPSNVKAGFSYDIQETPNNHLHDVAIRRAVLRRGEIFRGTKLLEVRPVDGEGWVLSPCKIPFHLPHMIYQTDLVSFHLSPIGV